MEDVLVPIMVVGMLFIGLPWLVFHYITKWKQAKTLTVDDERLLDDVHDTARRLEDRLVTIERIMRPAMTARRTDFYLDKQNAKWLGVCAGIADYTGIDRTWVRVAAVVLTIMGGFPWTLIAYWVTAWVANPKPLGLYDSPEDAKFWQGVRQSPTRSTRDVKAKFRDIDRRLADVETYYTSRNSSLANEIDALR
jgi:phage shock protein C